jgi:hypothetical protein
MPKSHPFFNLAFWGSIKVGESVFEPHELVVGTRKLARQQKQIVTPSGKTASASSS